MSREEREKRRESVQERKAEWEKRGKCREEKLTVKVVCAINETGLNGNEYVEMGDEHKWIGTNRDWMKCVGFII